MSLDKAIKHHKEHNISKKTFDKLDKMIDLLIEDMQMEGFLINMSKEEIYKYYEKRILLDSKLKEE